MLKNIVSKLYNHEEEQYLQLIRELIDENNNENSRSGETICNIGSSMYFSLENNKIPILTTKKVAVKTCLKELLWFLNGKTNNKILKEQNVKIWNDNASKDFLLSRGLNYEEDDLGPVYGHQWRYFNAPYTSCNDDYTNKGIDQIQNLIDNLKNPETRYSRRHIISAWNPIQIDEMALPPCHVLFQFHVTRNNKLSCSLYQRSGDVGLGVPFNIMSYSALTILIAAHCNLEPYEFIYFLGNTHIYKEHIDVLKEQIKREPYEFPTMTIDNIRQNINDYKLEDFNIKKYKYHDKLTMKINI
jgi:thymidylate synthase|tara:strand:- start:395 stop:1294 length:900 start_codon:yes stop_codon:yes gene_type:complete